MPRPAATVAVIRQGETRPEVLMLRRHSKAVFASHYVFPGGVLDDNDQEGHDRATGVSSEQATALIGLKAGALNYYSAGIRETFEEAGILFARDSAGRWALSDAPEEVIRNYRDCLNAGSLGWPEFLDQHDLHPAYDSLHYIAYWVTPRTRARRFSTRFFLAVVPEGQFATHDEGELTDSRWMTAAAVLAAGKRGEMKLIYPTLSTLSEIAMHKSVAQVMTWATQRGESGDAQLLPAFVDVDGKDRVVMPGSPHYPTEFET